MDTHENRGEINTESNRACRITPSKEGTVHGSCRLQYLSKPHFSHDATETNENCNHGQKWDEFGYWECWKSAAYSIKGRGTMTYSKTSEFLLLKKEKKGNRAVTKNCYLILKVNSTPMNTAPFKAQRGQHSRTPRAVSVEFNTNTKNKDAAQKGTKQPGCDPQEFTLIQSVRGESSPQNSAISAGHDTNSTPRERPRITPTATCIRFTLPRSYTRSRGCSELRQTQLLPSHRAAPAPWGWALLRQRDVAAVLASSLSLTAPHPLSLPTQGQAVPETQPGFPTRDPLQHHSVKN